MKPAGELGQRARTRRRGLLRVLGVSEGAAIGIGVAIGAGIFRTPGYVAGFLDAPWKILAAWFAGGLFVLGDCLILAELATRMPRAGGWYVYIEKGLGRFPAFVYGWTYMLVVDPASSAALVVVLSEYLDSLLLIGPTGGRIVGIGATTGLFCLSLAGVRFGARVQDAFTYTKLLALVAIGVVALFAAPAAETPGAASAPHALPAAAPGALAGLLAFGLALQGVLWTFEGYANTTTMTEESVDPRRTLPRALVFGAIALTVTYVLVNGAYLHVLGREGLAASVLPGADLFAQVFGGAGGRIFLLVAILAALGSLNGAALSAPRVAYALARSGLAPEPLTRVTRLGTPDLATLWFALAWGLYAWFGSFEGLVSVSIFIGALCNVAVTATLFTHRRRDRRTAAGEGTTTAGEGTTAAGEGTTAAGEGTTAAGERTTAAGERTTAAVGEAGGLISREAGSIAEGLCEPDERSSGPSEGETGGARASHAGAGSRAVFLSPLYPWLPIAMLILWIAFAADVLYDQGWKVGYGLLATAIAAGAYLWINRSRTAGEGA